MKRLTERGSWISVGQLSNHPTQSLTMHFCGFCGKGPFPSSSGLNKHIRQSVSCNKAACQKWGSYATNIWDNTPGPSNIEPQPPASPPILEDDEDELPDMPDITLEEDLQGLEHDLADARGSQPDTVTPPGPETQPARPQHQRATVEDAEDEESAYFIEEFPANFGAGAVWGEEVPFFEKLRREQENSGTSKWGPFEDQDDWELAEWLIRNIGQKQTDAFLNLNIVRSHRLVNFDRSLIVWTFDRYGSEQSHPITTTEHF
jgi:hypothetical protein